MLLFGICALNESSPPDDCGWACAPDVTVHLGNRTEQQDGLARPASMRADPGPARLVHLMAGFDVLSCCCSVEARLGSEGVLIIGRLDRPTRMPRPAGGPSPTGAVTAGTLVRVLRAQSLRAHSRLSTRSSYLSLASSRPTWNRALPPMESLKSRSGFLALFLARALPRVEGTHTTTG